MLKIISKVSYILKEEGYSIFLVRSFGYIKFLILTFFFSKNEIKQSFRSLDNKNKGGRIFILGNGPSLNRTPLYLLKNENVFCFNKFNLMLERLSYTPEFYSCVDDRVLMSTRGDIFEISGKTKYVFLPLVHPSSGKNFYKMYKKLKNVFWLIPNKFGYSIELPYCGINKSVTNCSLQIAAFMGFKEVYLLGVDLNYEDHKSVKKENKRDWTSQQDDDPNHFDPRYFGKGTQYHHPRLDETFKKWEEARIFFDRIGVKIYNATVGGKLEIFPRVNLTDVLNLTEKEEMLLFLSKFNISEYKTNQLIDYFPQAEIAKEGSKIVSDKDQVIAGTDTAVKNIPDLIFNYIPYGPIFNQYIFIKRGNQI